MKNLKEELFLIHLAERLSSDEIDDLYKNEVLKAEQFIKVKELIEKKDELELRKQEILSTISTMDKIEAEKKIEDLEKRKASKEKQEKIISEKISNVKNINEDDKKKMKKVGIFATIGLVILMAAIGIISYLFTNVIGFKTIDLSDYAIPTYETYNYTAQPEIVGSWIYYSESGYYDDPITELSNGGIYTKEEATALMPKDDTTLDVSKFVTGYELSKTTPVSNGDEISATIQYDEELAKSMKYKISNNKFSFTIKGLQQHMEIGDVTSDLVSTINITDEDVIATAKDDEYSPEDKNFAITRSDVFYEDKDSSESLSDHIVMLYEVKVTDKEIDEYSDTEYTTVYFSAPLFKQNDEVSVNLEEGNYPYNEGYEVPDEEVDYSRFLTVSYDSYDEWINNETIRSIQKVNLGGDK